MTARVGYFDRVVEAGRRIAQGQPIDQVAADCQLPVAEVAAVALRITEAKPPARQPDPSGGEHEPDR